MALSKATSESFKVTAEELGLGEDLAGELNWSETSQKYWSVEFPGPSNVSDSCPCLGVETLVEKEWAGDL